MESDSEQVNETPPASADKTSAAPDSHRFGRKTRTLVFFVIPFVVWVFGTTVRLTIRDSVPVFAAVFYATPLPVLAILAAQSGLSARRRDWNRLAKPLLIASLVQAMVWSLHAFRPEHPVEIDRPLRMAFWNVSRGTFGYSNVAREIVEMDADVVTMVEAVKSATNTEFWEEACPGYRAHRLGSGMMLLVRGSIHGVEKVRAARVGRWRIADVETQGKRFSVAVCDVTSHPLLFRKPVFDALTKMFESRTTEPLILAGDFNTPPDSVHYVGIRRHASNAFESAGEGFRETWPIAFPVLTLDQVWGNHKIEWQRCRHLWTAHSDHRPVVVEFTIKP